MVAVREDFLSFVLSIARHAEWNKLGKLRIREPFKTKVSGKCVSKIMTATSVTKKKLKKPLLMIEV